MLLEYNVIAFSGCVSTETVLMRALQIILTLKYAHTHIIARIHITLNNCLIEKSCSNSICKLHRDCGIINGIKNPI